VAGQVINCYPDQPIVVGDTPNFALKAQKNCLPWDMTGGSVSLYLKRPDQAVLGPFGAVVVGDTATYQVPSDTVLSQVGDWTRQWQVKLLNLEVWSGEIGFSVDPTVFQSGS
jgi:hypothetical protein